MENIYEPGIYTDLVREIAKNNCDVYIVSPREKRKGLYTKLSMSGNIHSLKIKVGNITKVGFIEKGISTITIENKYLHGIRKNFKGIKFDMVLYSTPPITFSKIIRYFKKKHNSKSYLILRDIFPQNAVDLELISLKGFIYKYFRNKEKKLYQISDIIGCMSQGNKEYVLAHNNIDEFKVEIFPNSIYPMEENVKKVIKENIYNKYDINTNMILFMYGGNLGKPQGIDFLIEIAKIFDRIKNGYLLIVGSGTEYDRIRKFVDRSNMKNIKLLSLLPRKSYNELLEIVDIGLIFLDSRFTIPNFPSRITAYMDHSLPILAATDSRTDLQKVLKESKSGFWSESGDIEEFIRNANRFSNNKELRIQMGINGRKFLEENYDIKKTVTTILKHLK